jgi:hypothetical protein
MGPLARARGWCIEALDVVGGVATPTRAERTQAPSSRLQQEALVVAAVLVPLDDPRTLSRRRLRHIEHHAAVLRHNPAVAVARVLELEALVVAA